jgi:hypothetical protein
VTAPVAPKPAASVLLVRPGAGSPLEVYMIRRQKGMRFLTSTGVLDNAASVFIDRPVEEGHGSRTAFMTPEGPVRFRLRQEIVARAGASAESGR